MLLCPKPVNGFNTYPTVGRQSRSIITLSRRNMVTIGLIHGWPSPDIQLDDGVQPSVTGKSDADKQATIHQWEIATCFILGADKSHFGKLQRDLQDNFARRTNQFPTTLTTAYNLLLTMEAALGTTPDTDVPDDNGGHGGRHRGPHRNNNSSGVGNPGNKQAHQANPARHTGLCTSLCFPHGAILLDTGASTSIIRDQDLLTNIGAREPPLTPLTYGGLHFCGHGGIYHGLQQPLSIWYAPDSFGNILVLCGVQRLCRITLDTATEAVFLVQLPDTTVLRFVEHTNGLYLLLPSDNRTTKSSVHSYSCVSTVTENRAVFTRQELEGADRTRQLYRTIGHPSQQKFETILDNASILNCPVTKADAQCANIIYGPDLAYLKGKMTKHPASPHVPTQVHSPLPAEITKYHLNVTLCLDFFYIQRLPFIYAISRKIGYHQAPAIPCRLTTLNSLLQYIN